MRAILLAAGYGTRLHPLTRDRPKPLLPVGGRPIIDHLVDRLEAAPAIEGMSLVTNARFAGDFERWAAERSFSKPLRIHNDGSTSNENRLGAVADMHLAVERDGMAAEGAYVLATDNLPRFDLTDIIGLASSKQASAVFGCRTDDPEVLRRVGLAQVDADGRIVAFEEKSTEPKGKLRVPPFYVYASEAVASIEQYLAEGGNPDAPGYFLEWLVPRHPVFLLQRPQGTYDIGTIKSYRQVCAEFEKAAEGQGGPSRFA